MGHAANNRNSSFDFTTMLNFLKRIYYRLPQSMYIGNRTYRQFRQMISKSEFNSTESIKTYQLQKLKFIVDYAWHNIQGYRELWDKHGFNPQMLKTLEDINKIPFVTREILKENIHLFTNFKLKNIKHITTGGSSGEPFGFYHQEKNIYIEMAFIHDMWSRFLPNVSMKIKRVALRGHKIKGLYYIKPANVMLLSSYSLNKESVEEIIKAIEKYKAPVLHAYPSSIYIFSRIIKDHQLKINHRFNLIALSSEPLMSYQKELVRDVFNAPISHWYGHTEKCVLAGYCEHEDFFHVYPQYGITELIDINGIQVKKGDVGEIVGTSFWNFATPFIRYKTSDYAELGDDNCISCGRNYQILNRIEGRLQDYVVDKDGHLISLTALIFAQHFEAFEHITSIKLVQKEIGTITVNIIPNTKYTQADSEEIHSVMKKVTKNRLDISIVLVDKTDRTSLGKQPFLKQYLNINDYI